MDTKSPGLLRGAAAAVSGARHLRIARNGQDAAGVWVADSSAAAVVCDGCGSSASSEVGARLGSQLVLAAIVRQLGCPPAGHAYQPAFWDAVRADVVASLDCLVRAMPGAREQIVHDYFLFTTIAAVMVGDTIVVWAIGDGAYAIDGRVRDLGPFADNQPPYLGYDLLESRASSMAMSASAHFAVARGNSVVLATDGVAEVGLDQFAGVDRFVDHPDALRRQLTLLARSSERVDWDSRRVVRTPALLQDDGAVAMLVRGNVRGAS